MSKVPGLLAGESVAAADDMPPRTLIDELLEEQQRLTAVERFARKHETVSAPAQARFYRDLMPTTRPAPGQQYAFAVDLDACTGCKSCVSACHSLNGLQEDEIWRNVGTIVGGSTAVAYQQTVTTACHHCLEPACLEGCPVMAYEKEPDTGIVRHLDDQCIGCQYCVLKCPYDVPKFSETLRIVRKCDLCANRLAVDEAPACVQACPTSAIRIDLVSVEEFRREVGPDKRLVPGAFPSDYTKPTTRYSTVRPMPDNAKPADADSLRLEDPHWPLVFMLVLTQAGIGGHWAFASLAISGSAIRSLATVSFATMALGLAVSVLHLGRPLGAWRFFLGLRTSWMSREILAFGMLAASGALGLLFLWVAPAVGFHPFLATLTSVLGAVALFSSAMIYIDTRRAWWSADRTLPSFLGTAALLGASLAAVVLAAEGASPAAKGFGVAATLLRSGLFAWESGMLASALRDTRNQVLRSARTIWSFHQRLTWIRVGLFAASTVAGVYAVRHSGSNATLAAFVSFLATATSAVIGRYLFFVAVVAPRMPGGIKS